MSRFVVAGITVDELENLTNKELRALLKSSLRHLKKLKTKKDGYEYTPEFIAQHELKAASAELLINRINLIIKSRGDSQ